MRSVTRRLIALHSGLALLAAMVIIQGCGQPSPVDSAPLETSRVEAVALPGGDLAGGAQSSVGADIPNPLEGQVAAVAGGKRLFVEMNCAGCHNYSLAGGMGPNLSDRYWRYGGTPAAIYQSIAAGRPQGMPAWYQALPPRAIWELVAYIESHGGASAPAQYHAGLQGDLASSLSPRP
jgi:cytochrome c oxidase cbb3-type subunit 3